MLKNLLITGDTHRNVSGRLSAIAAKYKPEETALIILGDAGINYCLDESDRYLKKQISKYGYTLYCVRGNHEARPSDVPGMHLVNDDFVGGPVWIEDEFPLIRYFTDWGIYDIQGLHTLVIGGAYSVDKHYRLATGQHWFENEQLAPHEMDACLRNAADHQFDLVLSHTCPRSLQPTDLFLSFVYQSTVDSTMERWMERLADQCTWKLWLWGHYHSDRVEWPHCEMFFNEIENIDDIIARWARYDETGKLDWWIPTSLKFNSIKEAH